MAYVLSPLMFLLEYRDHLHGAGFFMCPVTLETK
jgi:hypothetical protein